MCISKPNLLLLVVFLATGFLGCSPSEETERTSPTYGEVDLKQLPDRLPYAFTESGEPLYRDEGVRSLEDYSAALNALSILATVSRDSEYGHPAYQPDWSPEVMWGFAEAWLALVNEVQEHFLVTGDFPAMVGGDDAVEVDLSLLPHLAYAYHIHHRSGRFSENPALENRLNREASQLLVAPGRFLLENAYHEGQFTGEEGHVDFNSMAYGLGGLHGTAYAWVSWAKPDGEEDMGTLSEDHLAAFLRVRPEELAGRYAEVDDYLQQYWSPERSTYIFGEEAEPVSLDALGALLRGKKAMGDVLYMFGGEEGKERSVAVFERMAAMLETVFPIAEPWGMPESLIFEEDGVRAASEIVDLFHWYQFLNHLGGGYAFDREREGTASFFSQHRPDLLETWNALTDEALLGVLDYHLSGKGQLVRTVAFADGEVMDDQLPLRTLAMFITMAGNLYGKGRAFARPGEWAESDPQIAEQTQKLFDLSFEHWALVVEAVP